jgi:hypothetical protein
MTPPTESPTIDAPPTGSPPTDAPPTGSPQTMSPPTVVMMPPVMAELPVPTPRLTPGRYLRKQKVIE